MRRLTAIESTRHEISKGKIALDGDAGKRVLIQFGKSYSRTVVFPERYASAPTVFVTYVGYEARRRGDAQAVTEQGFDAGFGALVGIGGASMNWIAIGQ